jgi:hypothetical protein
MMTRDTEDPHAGLGVRRRVRFGFVLAAIALSAGACGTRQTPTASSKSGSQGSSKTPARSDGPVIIKQVHVGWTYEPEPAPAVQAQAKPRTNVFLSITDETGRVVSQPVGTFDGSCTDVGAIDTYRAIAALTCGQNGTGVQLHAVAGRGEVLVLQMDVAEGRSPDPMDRRQIARFEVPIDAKITSGP